MDWSPVAGQQELIEAHCGASGFRLGLIYGKCNKHVIWGDHQTLFRRLTGRQADPGKRLRCEPRMHPIERNKILRSKIWMTHDEKALKCMVLLGRGYKEEQAADNRDMTVVISLVEETREF
jgi:hypothetical protein